MSSSPVSPVAAAPPCTGAAAAPSRGPLRSSGREVGKSEEEAWARFVGPPPRLWHLSEVRAPLQKSWAYSSYRRLLATPGYLGLSTLWLLVPFIKKSFLSSSTCERAPFVNKCITFPGREEAAGQAQCSGGIRAQLAVCRSKLVLSQKNRHVHVQHHG